MDQILGAVDGALRTLFATPRATRPCPTVAADDTHLGAQERSHSAALMRVNHVGEVCAQALYAARALTTLNPLWYAGAFGLGLLAGRLGDPVSLGFVVETERQVEAHLQGHLESLPEGD